MSDSKDIDFDRIENAVRELLGAIGEDPKRDGLLDTPARVARMYGEICSGLREEPADHLEKTFQVEHDEIIVVRDISFYSICEHHLIPFFGKAHVAYLPEKDGRLPGFRSWQDWSMALRVVRKFRNVSLVRLLMRLMKSSLHVGQLSCWKPNIFACRCGGSASQGHGP
jgi:GTP cyclohydrolase I